MADRPNGDRTDDRTDTELLVNDCAALVERLTRRAIESGWITKD